MEVNETSNTRSVQGGVSIDLLQTQVLLTRLSRAPCQWDSCRRPSDEARVAPQTVNTPCPKQLAMPTGVKDALLLKAH